MQKITPHLWFDKEAKEAAALYTSIFPNSRIKRQSTLHNTPSGDVDLLSIELSGSEFALISAGPLFQFNPSISFLVACAKKDEVDRLWSELSKGGTPMMELGSYPFSERYGWIQDRYGVSWQLMYGQRQGITPVMMFTGSVDGKCEEAIRFYTSVFHHSSAGQMMHGPNGTVQFGQFMLEGQSFAAMDGQGQPHKFRFNEAISLIVHCDDQQEIDYYWERLSADPKAEQCGWLKDR
ncbi:MAG TPA: VOC family protein, partial [Thermoanaerobaculia bacterium]|nr:VOC family protein [Thermoanaerobaculia bacterium]